MKMKKLTLSSYFKRKKQNDPDTISEIVSYFKEHGELPFVCESENWIYDVMVERQKKRGKIIGQVMTPDSVAVKVATIAAKYKPKSNTVLDACCGTGQLTRQLIKKGFTVSAFDSDEKMVFAHNYFHPECNAKQSDYRDMDGGNRYDLIVSNPPFGAKDLKYFFKWLYQSLSADGVAILILPKEYIDKKRPKELAELLSCFQVKERKKITEKFPLVTEYTEIVVIELIKEEKDMKKNLPSVITDNVELPTIETTVELSESPKAKTEVVNTDNQTDEPEMIHQLDIKLIDPNPYNPRKYFKEIELHELATSIKNYKLIQPITVRRKENGRYEIICGERRYRASIIAGKTHIAAVIKDCSDEDSMEITIIENMERDDLSAIEEANSFAHLMEVRKYSIEDIMARFDKSESFVRGRLQLRNLIDEIAMMVIKNEISLGNAMELSKYNPDMQKCIYEEHLDEDNYTCWRELTTKDFAARLNTNYTDDLNNCTFDKTECKGCAYHSATYDLFAQEGEWGKCQNRTCLKAKQEKHMVDSALELAAKEKDAEICVSPYKNGLVASVKDKISEMGFDVAEKKVEKMPQAPEPPKKEDFRDEEKFNEAKIAYEVDYADFSSEMDAIDAKIKEGDAIKVIDISNGTPQVAYRLLTDKETAKRNENPIKRLKERDKRNKEIAYEKTVEDVKKFIKSDKTIIPGSPFEESENDFLYFLLMTKLRRSSMAKIGLKFLCDDDSRAKVLAKLTEEHKNIIKRDYIASLLSETFGVKKQSELLLKFVSLHFPEEVAAIQKVHDDVYESKHQSTLKRIAELEKLANVVNSGAKCEDTITENEVKDSSNLKEDLYIEETKVLSEGNDDFELMESNSPAFVGELNPILVDTQVMEFVEC